MIVTTGNEVEMGKIVQYLGIVRGIVVRSPSIGQGLMGGLKSIVGGNIEEFAQVCEVARLEAFNRMLQQAHEIGA
nr:heavy metal-binding domain-containing protein [Acidobacteriota bacterium]